MTAFKAQALMRDLKQRLELTVAGLTTSLDYDADKFPVLKCTKGAESLFVKIQDKPYAAGQVDALGLPQRKYTPHETIILREDAAGPTLITEAAMREAVTAESVKLGTALKIYEKDNPASYDLAGATLVAEIKSDAINPLTSQM